MSFATLGFVQAISLFLLAAHASAPNPPEFRWISNTRALAELTTGTCEILLHKPRQKVQISASRLAFILGPEGYVVQHRESLNPSINCHSFACSLTGIPLPQNAWLDPDRSYLNLIAAYFVNTNVEFHEHSKYEFERSAHLNEYDLVLFRSGRTLQHSGVVIKKNGRNWIYSKLDEDHVVVSPFDRLWDAYFADSALILRRKW